VVYHYESLDNFGYKLKDKQWISQQENIGIKV
jgi:hypothetical protein